MENLKNRANILLVSMPLLVVFVMFVSAFIASKWYDKAIYKEQQQAIYSYYLANVNKRLDMYMDEIISTDEDVFKKTGILLKNEDIIQYLKYIVTPRSDMVSIFKLEKDKKIVLYSTCKCLKIGKDELKDYKFHLSSRSFQKLLKDKKLYTEIDQSKDDKFYILYRYFSDTGIVVMVGVIQEKFNASYFNLTKDIVKSLHRQRYMVLLIEFFISIFAAFLITLGIKKILNKFYASQDELEVVNQSLQVSNERLKKRLYVDDLTNLPNMYTLNQDLSSMSLPKLLLVDIDAFDNISEYYGFKISQKLVLHIKDQLEEFTKINDKFGMKLYRSKTNQFALLENSPLDTSRYEMLAQKLLEIFKGQRVEFENGVKVEFNCTIGVSLEEKNVFKTASQALREARDLEKDYLCYFKVIGENEKYANQVKSAKIIRKAIAKDRVLPYFQPIFDRKQNVVKHECLARIIGEDGEVISPFFFLETSKRIKKYALLEKTLIEKSLNAIAKTDRIISINLSSRDMVDSDVSSFVIDKISKLNVAKQVIFEILEDENIESIKRVSSFIKRVKTMGSKIAIDDFGSGYSNFSYMLHLKPDYIKIDGSLIKDIDTDEKSQAIVSSILHFAKRLNIMTIAEFVHSKEVFECCLKLGVDEFQGFYLGKPAPKMK